MKKYGKYETRPEGTPAKQPKAKSMLLQTYLTSLLCMVLCVTMFFGTSYAWFTSEVTNSQNEIYIGVLDVGLYKQVADGEDEGTDPDFVSLADPTGEAKGTKLFDSNIRWEPGYTSLETIKIVNEGDLAFKYDLSFTDGKVDEGVNLADVAKYFDVWVYDHYDNELLEKTYEKPASYAALTAENSGWVPVGSLDELLAGKTVLDGNMVTVRTSDAGAPTVETYNAGTTDGVPTADTYTIALHMKEEATAAVMGKKITLNVKLVAYQRATEEDAFGNPNYDNVRFVTTAEELQKALDEATGGEIINLSNDITGNVTATQKENVKITIDGNKKNFNGTITVDGKSSRYETAALTIQNINFTGITGEDTVYIRLGDGTTDTRYTNNVTVKNCTFSGVNQQTAAIKSYTGGDYNLTVDGCTVDSGLHSALQVANIEKGLTVTNCKVYSKNGINLNNTPYLYMSGCEFDTKGYCVRIGVDGATNSGTFTIAGSTLKSKNDGGDAVVILRGTMTEATLTFTNTTLTGTPDITGTANIVK